MSCRFRRSRRSSRRPRLLTTWPASATVPWLGLSSATTSLPIVVFPQPDSPTRPNVSPAATLNDTPETAWTTPRVRCMTPCVIGYSLTRSRSSSSGPSPTAWSCPAAGGGRPGPPDPAGPAGVPGRSATVTGACLAIAGLSAEGAVHREPAGKRVVRALPDECRLVGAALVPGAAAARGEPAAGRGGRQVGRQAGDAGQPLRVVLVQPRYRGE